MKINFSLIISVFAIAILPVMSMDKILNFKPSDNGLVVMNEDYCGQYDAPNSIDVIAYTKDGGLTWVKSEETRDMINSYVDSYKMADDRLIFVVGLKVFEIKQQ